MRVYLTTIIILFNIYFVSSDKNDRAVKSVDFKSDKSEIEFGRSITDDFEPRSGDFNSDDTHFLYYDEPDDKIDEEESSRENEIDYANSDVDDNSNNSTEVTEKIESKFPNEVFLKLRNITDDPSTFRSFSERNDEIDLQASATDNVSINDSNESVETAPVETTSTATIINLRRLRDARPPPDFDDNSGIPLFAPFKHKKIDTAALSDCALQGEWRPMGVDNAHHLISQQLTVSDDVHQEPEVLQSLGTNKVPKKHLSHHHFDQDEFLRLQQAMEHINPSHLKVVQASVDVNNNFKEFDNVDFLSPPPMPSSLIAKLKPEKWKPQKIKQKRKKPPKEVKDSIPESTYQQHQPPLHQLQQPFSNTDDFTCGKNHDHGTKFHSASFQVAEDSDGQYLKDESVLIGNNDELWDQASEHNPNFDPWSDKYQSTIGPLQDYLHASKRASNHRYPKQDIYQDQLEEPSAHRYYHDINHVSKYPSQFYEPGSSGELRDDTDQPEIIRELEQISNQFQLDLENPHFVNPPPQELANGNFYNEDYHNQDEQSHGHEQYHANVEQSHQGHASPVFHHSGYNFVNIPGSGNANGIDYTTQNHYSSEEVDRPADFYYHQKINQELPTSYVSFGHNPGHNPLPISTPDVHPPPHDKPKKHKPPKRKHPHKTYEVHEESGEKQRPLNEIFPPKKNPKQFNNRMPNFAVTKPKKGKKPPKKENLYAPQKIEYETIVHTPIRTKKIKKFRPKTKLKFKNQRLRRPVTDSTLKVSTPIIRVVEVTSS